MSSATARLAYETLEPFHVLAYFNPGLSDAYRDTGLDPHAFYVGSRGAPLGDCASAVVVSSFYNFAPDLVDKAWSQARTAGLEKVSRRRWQMLDDQIGAILGAGTDRPEIDSLTARYARIVDGLPLSGRPLAAAWAASEIPEQSNLQLWHRIAVLREWRGDNHIAVLLLNDLDGIDAVIFHEAEHPDPSVRRRVLGRRMIQLTRGWSDSDWEAAVDRLADRGLVTRTDDGHRLTDAGVELYASIEDATDAAGAAAWSGDDAADLLAETRPVTKAVIDAGVLPGTRR